MYETGVYEHPQSVGRNYYGNYGENQLEVVHLCVSIYVYLYINIFRIIILLIPVCFLVFYLIARVINNKNRLLFIYETNRDIWYFSRRHMHRKMVVYHHQQTIIQIWWVQSIDSSTFYSRWQEKNNFYKSNDFLSFFPLWLTYSTINVKTN